MIGSFQTSKSLNIREREYRCLCSYYVINTYASLMYELKKILEKYLRVTLLGLGPSFYKNRIYRAAVSQRLRDTVVVNTDTTVLMLVPCIYTDYHSFIYYSSSYMFRHLHAIFR
jgi:hypothetical protein